MSLKNHVEAYQDLKHVMSKDPENSEANADLQDCMKKLGTEGV